MIRIQNGVFQLDTAHTSYVFALTEYGHPEHIYYSATLPPFDIEALRVKRTAEFGGVVRYREETEGYSLDILPQEETVTPYYVRFLVPSRRSGVIATIAQVLAKHDISISSTSSTAHEEDEAENVQNDLVFTLHACAWGQLKSALKEIAATGCIEPHPAVFRIETFNS